MARVKKPNATGKYHWNWKGGRHQNPRGYWVCIVPKGHPSYGHRHTMLEHRMKMEKKLGRRLRSQELVHHKNENPSDNRICNLEVMDRRAHSYLHRIGKRATERTKAKASRTKKGKYFQKENHPQYKHHVTKEKLQFLLDSGMQRKHIAWILDLSMCGLRWRMKEYKIYKDGRYK